MKQLKWWYNYIFKCPVTIEDYRSENVRVWFNELVLITKWGDVVALHGDAKRGLTSTEKFKYEWPDYIYNHIEVNKLYIEFLNNKIEDILLVEAPTGLEPVLTD